MEPNNATVLAAKIQGFSELSLKSSAKELNALLKEYYELTEATIRLHHGKLSNFSGDSFLAVFMEKKNGHISELLAIEASREIHEKLDSFLKISESDISMGFRAGIATGEAIVGEINSGSKSQVTVMGEAATLATRLCDFAENKQILVCDKVFRRAKGQYHFQKQEPLPIKGSKALLEVFELREKKKTKLQPGSFSKRQIDSEMVGRSHEMEQMESHFKKLLEGKGSIVNIVGKAGIGKSRLMAEIKVQPIMEKVLLLEGRASSTGQNLSFHPITNLIKSWAGITEDDLPSHSSKKLFEGIKRNTSEQADEIYSFLATMMGLPLEGKYKERVKGIEGEALEKLILKNLRDLIISATKDKPRIYVIEDMHWADSSSLTLFESLYKLSQKYPVMFINVMRPGYKETGDYILKYLVDHFPGDHTTINVNPLEEKESGNLINNLLRKAQLPKDIEKMIIRKTEGNPFFIEEIIRSLIDEGIIEVKGGHFIVTEKINDVNIPETINEAILSRVDKLDEKTRELLNTASVMGRNFYYKVLEEATDTIEELDDRLSYLTEVQLISESKKKQEVEYLFKHALAQQLTYDSMMQQSRKDTHLKIARSIEKVFAANINEFYGTLVYHYELAEDKEKAIYYMLLAGDESMKSGASSEALQFFEKALEAMPRSRKEDAKDNKIRDLRIKLAKMYHAVGRFMESIKLFEQVFDKYFNFRFAKTELGVRIKGMIAMLFFVFISKNESFYFKLPLKNEHEIFFKTLRESLYTVSTVNPKHFVLKSAYGVAKFRNYNIIESIYGLAMYSEVAAVLVWAGFSPKTCKRILDSVQKHGILNSPQSLTSFYLTKAMLDYNTGNWHRNKNFDKIYTTSIGVGEIYLTAIITVYYCYQQLELGDFSIISETKEKFEEMAYSFENSHARTNIYRIKSFGLLKFRKFNHLQEFLNEGIVLIENTDNKMHLLVLYLVQVQLFIYNEKIKSAAELLKRIEKDIKANKMVLVIYTHYLLSKNQLGLKIIKAQQEKGESDKSKIKEFISTSNKLISKSKQFVPNLTQAYILRATFYVSQKKHSKALKFFQKAINSGEKFNGRLELSRAYFETGKFLSDPKIKQNQLNGLLGKDYLEKAKVMFEEMDLQWDLEEYEDYLKQRE